MLWMQVSAAVASGLKSGPLSRTNAEVGLTVACLMQICTDCRRLHADEMQAPSGTQIPNSSKLWLI